MPTDSTKELTLKISRFKWIYFLLKNSTKLWWADPLNIICVYPSWISSASRDLQNYHFTLLAVISSTPLSLVNKLETMYWRGANKSHCFIQKSQDSIWTLASSFIHTPRNKAWGDIHCISAILYMNSISMRTSQSYSWHTHNLVLHQ